MNKAALLRLIAAARAGAECYDGVELIENGRYVFRHGKIVFRVGADGLCGFHNKIKCSPANIWLTL